EGDSNPRYLSVYTISSRAPSASRSSLRVHASGERGIRTPGTLASTPDFESGAFNRSAISPELHEKRFEERRALVGEDPSDDRHRVIQATVAWNRVQRLRRARLGVLATIDEARDPRVDQRPRAHRTRLLRHVQRRLDAPVTDPARGVAERFDLGVRGRIAAHLAAVATA